MLSDSLRSLLARDIAGAMREIDAYPDDAAVWRPHPAVPNTGGTLALHLAGNIRHFIGNVLGNDGYLRDRDAEFSRRDVPRAELRAQLAAALEAVNATLPRLSTQDLAATYPLPVANVRLQTGDFLMHLAVHFGYHLGQMDYHRRAVAGAGAGIGAVSPAQLHSAVPLEPGTA